MTILQSSDSAKRGRPISLALGGGGARGLAHIPMLQVFDDLGIKPQHIAGTSMGAIVGAMYASGMPASAIRELVDGMVLQDGEGLRDALKKRGLLRWLDLFDPKFVRGGVFKGDKMIDFFEEVIGVEKFEDLQIPLSVVATEFYTGKEVVFDSGPLMPALRATMSLPGLFTPIEVDGRLLIDGGCVNPVPHDLLDESHYRVAVDVRDLPQRRDDGKLGLTNTLIGAVEIMSHQVGLLRRKANPPELYLHPKIQGYQMGDFFRAQSIFKNAEPVCDKLREALTEAVRS